MKHSLLKSSYSKGFLFTIAVILFASTLTIYAQSYANVNFSAERSIISSARPVNVLLLNDDLAFDVLSLLRMSVDVNKSYPDEAQISGDFLSSRDISGEFTDYASFLSATFFSRSLGSEVIDLSAFEDGKAELLFGDFAQLDYNYSNNLFLFPLSGSLDRIDINLMIPGEVSSVVWSPSGGAIPVYINYQGDAGRESISGLISGTDISSLKINTVDGNTWVYLGLVTLNGYAKSSSIAIVPQENQKLRYSVRARYSSGSVLLPLKANAILRVNRDSVDSNAFLTIER